MASASAVSGMVLAIILCTQLASGVDMPCTNGFPEQLNSSGTSRSNGATRLIPDMNISCSGVLVGWSVGGRMASGATITNEFPSLKVFRPSTLAYSYVGEVELGRCGDALAETSQSGVYTCSLPVEGRLPVMPTDIIAIFSPDQSTLQVGFVVHFLSGSTSAPRNHIYSMRNVTSDVSIAEADGSALNTPVVNLDIATGNIATDNDIATTTSITEELHTTTFEDFHAPTVRVADLPATTHHTLPSVFSGGNLIIPTLTTQAVPTHSTVTSPTPLPLESSTTRPLATTTDRSNITGPTTSMATTTDIPPSQPVLNLPLIITIIAAIVVISILLIFMACITIILCHKKGKKTSSVADSGAVNSTEDSEKSKSETIILDIQECVLSSSPLGEGAMTDVIYTEISDCVDREATPQQVKESDVGYETIQTKKEVHTKPCTLEVRGKLGLYGPFYSKDSRYDRLGSDVQYEKIGGPDLEYDKVSRYEQVTGNFNPASYETNTAYKNPSTYETTVMYEKPSTYETAMIYEKPSTYEVATMYEKPTTYETATTYEKVVTYEKVTSSFTETPTE